MTSGRTTRQLAPPFVVIATQNPIEYEGTYPLPEAQLDRFILRSRVGYPTLEHERELLMRRIERAADEVEITPVVDAQTLVEMQRSLELVHVSEPIVDYIARLVRATRDNPRVQVGASPRGGLALLKLSRGKAVLAGPRVRDAGGREGGRGAGARAPADARARSCGCSRSAATRWWPSCSSRCRRPPPRI